MVRMAHNTVAIRPFACSCSPLYCQTEDGYTRAYFLSPRAFFCGEMTQSMTAIQISWSEAGSVGSMARFIGSIDESSVYVCRCVMWKLSGVNAVVC